MTMILVLPIIAFFYIKISVGVLLHNRYFYVKNPPFKAREYFLFT